MSSKRFQRLRQRGKQPLRGRRQPPRPGAVARPITVTMRSAPVGPSIVVRDRSQLVAEAELWAAAAALAKQVNEHFAVPAPFGWGLGIKGIRVETPSAPARPEEWVLLLSDAMGDGGSYAWHDHTDAGTPLMVVLPRFSRVNGSPWTLSASHEILETLADPNLSLAGVGADGRVRALEVVDPVQARGYPIDGVTVANFVLPGWFQPMRAPPRLDYLGQCTQPGQILAGGYCYVYEGGDWIEEWNRTLDGDVSPKDAERKARDELRIGRGVQRRVRTGRIR